MLRVSDVVDSLCELSNSWEFGTNLPVYVETIDGRPAKMAIRQGKDATTGEVVSLHLVIYPVETEPVVGTIVKKIDW